MIHQSVFNLAFVEECSVLTLQNIQFRKFKASCKILRLKRYEVEIQDDWKASFEDMSHRFTLSNINCVSLRL